MARKPSALRAKADRIYSASDSFFANLRQVETSRANIQVRLSLQDSDIEALCFLVLIQASKSAKEDLKAIMDTVKQINKEKEGFRDRGNKLKQDEIDFESAFQLLAVLCGKTIEQELDMTQERLDSQSDMGEMESLRLQMALDRLSKMMSTLSNLLKKMSDTQSQIVQNLK
jgi:hypothetical protein